MRPLPLRRSIALSVPAFLLFLLIHAATASEASALTKHPACDMCHVTANPDSGGQLLAEESDPSSVCLRCHDYKQNHHPVYFVPVAPKQASPAKEFPLFNGEIRCLTCHDPHGGRKFSETPNLLRGGPYADRRDICFKCHFREKYADVDPHIMKNSEGNLMVYFDKPVCLLCHAVMPDPSVDRTGDVKFRADVGFLCWRCHPPMPGEFFKRHFLVKPSRRTLNEMKRSEKERQVILPLVPRGRITCATCHNPHQKEAVMYEPAKTGADSHYRLRMQSPGICVACHSTK